MRGHETKDMKNKDTERMRVNGRDDTSGLWYPKGCEDMRRGQGYDKVREKDKESEKMKSAHWKVRM